MKDDLHSAQFLIIKNPKWGISLIDVNDDNGETTETLDTLVNIIICRSIFRSFFSRIIELIHFFNRLQDKLFSARLNGKIGMTILNPELPMQCLVKNKLFTVFSSLLVVAIGKVLTDCLF